VKTAEKQGLKTLNVAGVIKGKGKKGKGKKGEK